jgi:hypothetical protein
MIQLKLKILDIGNEDIGEYIIYELFTNCSNIFTNFKVIFSALI